MIHKNQNFSEVNFKNQTSTITLGSTPIFYHTLLSKPKDMSFDSWTKENNFYKVCEARSKWTGN